MHSSYTRTNTHACTRLACLNSVSLTQAVLVHTGAPTAWITHTLDHVLCPKKKDWVEPFGNDLWVEGGFRWVYVSVQESKSV